MKGISDIGFLFDLDGVLIDSEREYTRIWSDIESKYPTGVSDFPRVIKGTTLPHILDTYFPENIHAQIVRELVTRENHMVYDYCPGAEKTLAALKEYCIPAAIVTSSMPDKMEKLFRIHPELRSMVGTVVDASVVTHSKPDPQGYLIAADRLGRKPSRCVVIEDSLQGMAAGKNAGAFVIGLSMTLGEKSVAGHADKIIDTLADISVDEILSLINR